MTPKEKAKELLDKYYNDSYYITLAEAKQLALIAVDLAIEYSDFHIEFLQEVKQEIEKL